MYNAATACSKLVFVDSCCSSAPPKVWRCFGKARSRRGCARVSWVSNGNRQRSVRAAARIATDIISVSLHGLTRPVLVPQGLPSRCGDSIHRRRSGACTSRPSLTLKASLAAYPKGSLVYTKEILIDGKLVCQGSLGLSLLEESAG
jgi:hypothetical protein